MKESGTTFNKFTRGKTTNGKRDPKKLTKSERLKQERAYAPVKIISAEEYNDEKRSA